jgi:hypothetical protein
VTRASRSSIALAGLTMLAALVIAAALALLSLG